MARKESKIVEKPTNPFNKVQKYQLKPFEKETVIIVNEEDDSVIIHGWRESWFEAFEKAGLVVSTDSDGYSEVRGDYLPILDRLISGKKKRTIEISDEERQRRSDRMKEFHKKQDV